MGTSLHPFLKTIKKGTYAHHIIYMHHPYYISNCLTCFVDIVFTLVCVLFI